MGSIRLTLARVGAVMRRASRAQSIYRSVFSTVSMSSVLWLRNSGISVYGACGAMVIARTSSPLALAETLVHEFQHSKLAALLHLFPLADDDRVERALKTVQRRAPLPVSSVLFTEVAVDQVTKSITWSTITRIPLGGGCGGYVG